MRAHSVPIAAAAAACVPVILVVVAAAAPAPATDVDGIVGGANVTVDDILRTQLCTHSTPWFEHIPKLLEQNNNMFMNMYLHTVGCCQTVNENTPPRLHQRWKSVRASKHMENNGMRSGGG